MIPFFVTQPIFALWALLAGALGLLCAGIGLKRFSRRSGRARTSLYLGTGIILVSVAGFLGWKSMQEAPWLPPPDSYENPEHLEQLKSLKLNQSKAEKKADGDWPQWRGPHRDGASQEKGLLLQWPAAGPPVLWRKPIQGGYSSLAVTGGRLFTMDRDGNQERILCLDALDGTALWSYTYEADYAKIDYGKGPRATPTAADGRVYTVAATGALLCLEANPSNGQAKVLWRHDLQQEFDAPPLKWGFSCSPRR
jgi:hypothetical protein